MPRIVHVAVVRVYRSLSSYGSASFTVPAGSPKIVTVGGEVLEIHLGDVPAWLKRAEARVRINGEALLRGLFQNDLVGREQLNARLSQAKDHVFVDERHKWLIAVVLRRQIEWSETDINDEPWLWCNPETFIETEKSAKERIASLDLAARVLKHYLPNGVDEVVVADRIYVGRDESFGDAFGMPHFTAGATGSAQSQLDGIEAALAGPEMQAALANAIAAPAVPKDSRRPDRFKAALHSDLLADEGGTYGRYELLREMQPVLMRASSTSPLAVMFVDMNGLKQINDGPGGHRAGDEAIAEFRMAVREAHQGALFRTGGDEFVLFRLGARGDASTVARKILSAVAARQVHGTQLSASVGVVFAIDPSEEPDAIRHRADQQMYRAKERSRSYTPRPCVLAIEDTEPVMIDPPDTMTASTSCPCPCRGCRQVHRIEPPAGDDAHQTRR